MTTLADVNNLIAKEFSKLKKIKKENEEKKLEEAKEITNELIGMLNDRK